MRLGWRRHDDWDLSALLNAADPTASAPERNLWLVRLLEWLRREVRRGPPSETDADTGALGTPEALVATPGPLLRLRHLLNVLDRHPAERERVLGLLRAALPEAEIAALFADLGFTGRRDLRGELAERLRLRLLPESLDTPDLSRLFALVFARRDDADWLAAMDADTLERVADLIDDALAEQQDATLGARGGALTAVTWLISAVRASAFVPTLRRRMDPALLARQPFEQLTRSSEDLILALRSGDALAVTQCANLLRGLLDEARVAAESVYVHLEEHGVSVDLVFEVEQMRRRIERTEVLLTLALDPAPRTAVRALIAELIDTSHQRRSVRALLAEHYDLLARKVAERSAETGQHYITRNRAEYLDMLRRALGGGAVIAGTTFAKFALGALALTAFWSGLAAGLNYAFSFVLIHLLHWTVATKQPAMTAPALAARLRGVDVDDTALETFVDEVTHLIRSQIAGIVGNLAMVVPLVLAVQALWIGLQGAPLVSEKDARYVLHTLTLLGPTLAYAAFTGVLLFAASLIAGWVENWFVWHRLDRAIAWHPRFVAVLGAPRAQRWARWWRVNISGLAANLSLGLLLGLVPVIGAFFALPLEVRHVTLGTGQVAAALATLGPAVLHEADFWWCVAAIPGIGALNLLVSFTLAFRVALRSRGVKVRQRGRIYAAVWRRLRQQPGSFLLPPPRD